MFSKLPWMYSPYSNTLLFMLVVVISMPSLELSFWMVWILFFTFGLIGTYPSSFSVTEMKPCYSLLTCIKTFAYSLYCYSVWSFYFS